jgi:hypothetical protein
LVAVIQTSFFPEYLFYSGKVVVVASIKLSEIVRVVISHGLM